LESERIRSVSASSISQRTSDLLEGRAHWESGARWTRRDDGRFCRDPPDSPQLSLRTDASVPGFLHLSEAAREGTRYAMVHGSTCESSVGISCTATGTTGAGSFPSVDSYVSHIGLPNLGGGTMNVVTTYPDGDEVAPHRVAVSVTYTFPYKIPFVSSGPISFSSRSEMSILQ
jgi:hypothetical protein